MHSEVLSLLRGGTEGLSIPLHEAVRGPVLPVLFLRCGAVCSKLKRLAPDHVQALYQRKLDSGLASSTVRQIHSVLSCALDQAMKWGIVPRNVCKATTPPKPDAEEIKPLDLEQARQSLRAASGERFEALYVSP